MRRKPTPLKVAMATQGLIQADIAQRVGISESRLSRIANGRIKPTEAEVRHFAQILDIPKEALA